MTIKYFKAYKLKLFTVFTLYKVHLIFFDNLAQITKSKYLVFIKLYKQSDDENREFFHCPIAIGLILQPMLK